MQKKSQAFVLLLLCSIPYLFIAFFHIRQTSIKQRMHERLEETILHTVTIPEKELVWIKQGKEIFFEGKMFDIKTIDIENGICHITGLFDEEETLLTKQLEKARGAADFSNHQWLVSFLQIFQSVQSGDVEAAKTRTMDQQYDGNKEDLSTVYLPVTSPPPQAEMLL